MTEDGALATRPDGQTLGADVYHALTAHTYDLVAILEADGTLRYASPSYERILGYTPAELRGTNSLDRIHPDDVERVRAVLQQVRSGGGRPVHVRCRYRHADGSWRVMDTTGSSHLDDPQVRGIVITARDVTEQAQAEARLREKEELLEQRVDERTRELSTLLDVASHVASTLELQPLLQHILDGLDALVERSGAAILVVEGGLLRVQELRLVPGMPAPTYMELPLDRLRIWPLLSRNQPFVIDDMHAETPDAAAARALWGERWAEARDHVRSYVAVPLAPKGRMVGALIVAHPAPGYFTFPRQALMMAIANQAAVAIENARLYEQAATQARELAALLDVAHHMTSTLELEPLLRLILDQTRAVIDHSGSAIVVVEGEQLRMLDYRLPPGGAGAAVQAPTATVFPPERFPLWSSLARREPVVIDDLYGETPQAVAYRAALGARMAVTHGPVRAYLAVPMVLQERVIGALALSHVDVGYFTARHVAVTQAIANQAAIAIENARLYGRAQEAAALEERQRLARELHDSVSQALYGIALGARTAHALLERDPAQVGEPLEYVVSLAEAGLAEMRALILELLPEAIATDGLVAALEKQIAALRARHRIAVTAALGSEPEVSLETKEALYRIAQEALHNVVKHARARSVEVQLACGPEGLLLDVSDDGVGFDTGAAFPGHLGLRTMRERATGAGGTLEMTSAPGGTRIRVRIPQ